MSCKMKHFIKEENGLNIPVLHKQKLSYISTTYYKYQTVFQMEIKVNK